MVVKSRMWRLGVVVILAAGTILLLWGLPSARIHSATGTAAKAAAIASAPPGAAHPWHSNDPYQLMLDQAEANPGRGVARMVAALVHYHEKVADAEDDPAWARPMERRMRAAILADPVAEKLEIASVACRKRGCELHLFETHPSASHTDVPAWFQAIERMRKSDLGSAVDMDANFGSRYGDRIMYVTTFKRKLD